MGFKAQPERGGAGEGHQDAVRGEISAPAPHGQPRNLPFRYREVTVPQTQGALPGTAARRSPGATAKQAGENSTEGAECASRELTNPMIAPPAWLRAAKRGLSALKSGFP